MQGCRLSKTISTWILSLREKVSLVSSRPLMFPEVNVSEGKIEVEGKQNSLFPARPVIKRFVILPNPNKEKTTNFHIFKIVLFSFHIYFLQDLPWRLKKRAIFSLSVRRITAFEICSGKQTSFGYKLKSLLSSRLFLTYYIKDRVCNWHCIFCAACVVPTLINLINWDTKRSLIGW